MSEVYDPNSENNEKNVILSEELDFLESLLTDYELTPDAVSAILERRDIVRDAMATAHDASPEDEADEGTPLPGESE